MVGGRTEQLVGSGGGGKMAAEGVAAGSLRRRWRGSGWCVALQLLLWVAPAELMEEHLKREHSLTKPYQGEL